MDLINENFENDVEALGASSALDIHDLIPHRAPMLLVDTIVEYDLAARTIEARKFVKENDFFLQGHYPEFKLVPGIITSEMLFQTGAVLIAQLVKDGAIQNKAISEGGNVPVITRSDNTRFKSMIRPGDDVQLKVELVDTMGPAIYMKGRALVKNKVAVSLEFVCMMAPRPKEVE